MNELCKFLCVAAPFGTPVDTNVATIQSLVNLKDITVPLKSKVCSFEVNIVLI